MQEQASAHPVALVTGASRGLGLAMSRALARAGFGLAMLAQRRGPLLAAARSLAAETEVLPLPIDLTDPKALDGIAGALRARFGRLDLLVNNAGVMGGESGIEALEPKLWEHMLAVNLSAPLHLCRLLLPLLLEQRRSCIVNITSGAAVRTGFLNIGYGITKAGLDRLTLGLAAEQAGSGLACVSLSPPVSATDTVRALYPDQGVDSWAAEPELTARALLRLLQLDPARFSGQVIGARELLHQHGEPD
jgi:NAD(P)-dependent dehydrogenase (short-subunit alcohol dehydrogenase family)